MKRAASIWTTIAVAVILLGLTGGNAMAEVRIIDGDTFETKTERIRLFGIDAPERDQPGGPQATEALRRLVGRADPICTGVDEDRYGRMVALCSVDDVDLSLAMVRAGHAVAWCYYLRKQRKELLARFRVAEAEARKAKLGIWAKPFTAWRDWKC